MPTIDVTPEVLINAARRLPSSPRVFSALEAALRNPDVDVDSVVNIVRVDASLAVRVVKAANSPIFRRGDAIESLDEAIGRIGLREIHRLVGAAVADHLFAVGLPMYRISGDDLWLNTLITALGAEQLAMVAGRSGPEAYTLGLLRSSGRMLLERIGQEAALPPMSGAKNTGDETRSWEVGQFGITADEAGAELMALWEFGEPTVNGVRHGWDPTSDSRHRPEPALLHLACAMADHFERGLKVESQHWEVTEALLKQAGLDRERYEAALQPTRDAVNRTLEVMKPGESI